MDAASAQLEESDSSSRRSETSSPGVGGNGTGVFIPVSRPQRQFFEACVKTLTAAYSAAGVLMPAQPSQGQGGSSLVAVLLVAATMCATLLCRVHHAGISHVRCFASVLQPISNQLPALPGQHTPGKHTSTQVLLRPLPAALLSAAGLHP